MKCESCTHYNDTGTRFHFNTCDVIGGCIDCFMNEIEILDCKEYEKE
jgi:hypothetical protein